MVRPHLKQTIPFLHTIIDNPRAICHYSDGANA